MHWHGGTWQINTFTVKGWLLQSQCNFRIGTRKQSNGTKHTIWNKQWIRLSASVPSSPVQVSGIYAIHTHRINCYFATILLDTTYFQSKTCQWRFGNPNQKPSNTSTMKKAVYSLHVISGVKKFLKTFIFQSSRSTLKTGEIIAVSIWSLGTHHHIHAIEAMSEIPCLSEIKMKWRRFGGVTLCLASIFLP